MVQAGHSRLDLSHPGLLILHTTTAGSGRTPELKECGSADWIPGVPPVAALLLAPGAPVQHAVRSPFQHARRNPARPGPPPYACAGRNHAPFQVFNWVIDGGLSIGQ